MLPAGKFPPGANHILLDSYLIPDVLPPEIAATALEDVYKEVFWHEMFHRGGAVPRLVAIQGDIREGDIDISAKTVHNDPKNTNGAVDTTSNSSVSHKFSYAPLYRHPVDHQPPLVPWTPTVRKLRDLVCARMTGSSADNPGRGEQKQQTLLLNHALIQVYRNGHDYISEHADKTLDVVKGSTIVNLSLGAERVMTLRPKRDSIRAAKAQLQDQQQQQQQQQHQQLEGKRSDLDESFTSDMAMSCTIDPQTSVNSTRIPPEKAPQQQQQQQRRPTTRFSMPHNSLFALGWTTNQRQTHEIRRDKRPISVLPEECQGMRISITFRHVGTFYEYHQHQKAPIDYNYRAPFVFGQGAFRKKATADMTVEAIIDGDAKASQVDEGAATGSGGGGELVVLLDEHQKELEHGREKDRLLQAFSDENRYSDFNWDAAYGRGFDIINFSSTITPNAAAETEAKATTIMADTDIDKEVATTLK